MLKNIPKLLSPELVKTLMEMGHGDEIVIGDGNFPAASVNARVIRMDGHGVSAILDAALQLFPLDSYVTQPVALMDVVPGDDVAPVIWDEYANILRKHGSLTEPAKIERFAFYERARAAFCVVATSEPALYANIILKKGIVRV
jgi:L-fucose mutarotase